MFVLGNWQSISRNKIYKKVFNWLYFYKSELYDSVDMKFTSLHDVFCYLRMSA